MRKIAMLLFFVLAMGAVVFGQATYEDERYVPETDPLVLKKLAEWQNFKFGLLMHWGTYSQWGIVESWSLCPEDEGWCKREKGANPKDYFSYKKEYEDLQTTFNPTAAPAIVPPITTPAPVSIAPTIAATVPSPYNQAPVGYSDS